MRNNLLVATFLLLNILLQILYSQEFERYQVWTSENYSSDPVPAIDYSNIVFTVVGDFDGNGIEEIALLVRTPTQSMIYTVESTVGNIASPTIQHWKDPNNQSDYMKHPTILKMITDNSLFDFDAVKYAVAGDYNGDNKDEIALFYDYNNNPLFPQRIYVTKHDNSLTYWTYELKFDYQYSSFNFNAVKFAVAGDYDGNGRDEIAMFYDYGNGTQKIFVTHWNPGQTNWWYACYFNGTNSSLNIGIMRFTVSGDYDGNGRDEIAIFYDYGNDATSAQRIYVTNGDYSGPMWTKSLRMNTSNQYLNFDMIRQAVGGNYDGIINSGSTGKDEIALFYDYGNDLQGVGSLQTVFVTYGDASWNYAPKIRETNNTLDFDKLLFVFSGNLDADIKSRDEIGFIYNDVSFSSPEQIRGDRKILVALSRPLFSQNDLILNTDNNQFFPLGWFGVSNTNLATISAQGYNSVIAYRQTFSDHMLPLNTFSYDNEYVAGLSSYLNTAQAEGIKVIADMRTTIPENNTLAYFDALNSPGISDHPALFGWQTADEPTHDTVNFSAFKSFMETRKDSLVKPTIPVFTDEDDFEYYHNAYDVAAYDYYPFFDDVDYPFLSAYLGKLAVESAIKYDKEGVIFIAQGEGEESQTLGANNQTANQVRYCSFAPIIEGIRGLYYFSYQPNYLGDPVHYTNDVVRDLINNNTTELINYIPVFKTRPLFEKISCNKDRFVGNDIEGFNIWDFRNGQMRYAKQINYSLHYLNNIYYLFVVNNNSNPINNVAFNVFGVPNSVYSINTVGAGSLISSTNDLSGEFISFSDIFQGFEVKIYTFGNLPPIQKRGTNHNLVLHDRSTFKTNNFPNPFNPTTTINYFITQPGIATITVFNMLGQEITTIVNRYHEAGKHSVIWNATGLPSGAYFYRVTTNGYTETVRMTVLK